MFERLIEELNKPKNPPMEDFSTAVLLIAGVNLGLQEQATLFDATLLACAAINTLFVGNYTNRIIPEGKSFILGAITMAVLSSLVEIIEPEIKDNTPTPNHLEMPQGGICRANICQI